MYTQRIAEGSSISQPTLKANSWDTNENKRRDPNETAIL